MTDEKIQITILFDYEIHADEIFSTGMIKLNMHSSELSFKAIKELIIAKLKRQYNTSPDMVKLTAMSASIKDLLEFAA